MYQDLCSMSSAKALAAVPHLSTFIVLVAAPEASLDEALLLDWVSRRPRLQERMNSNDLLLKASSFSQAQWIRSLPAAYPKVPAPFSTPMTPNAPR